MFKSTEKFLDVIKQRGVDYELKELHQETRHIFDAVYISVKGLYDTVGVWVIFAANDSEVMIRIYENVKIPAAKITQSLNEINCLNCAFKFVKFYLDEDSTIVVCADNVFDFNDEHAGENCDDWVNVCVCTYDDAYRKLVQLYE